MTRPDPLAEAVREPERVLDVVSRVGPSNLARGDVFKAARVRVFDLDGSLRRRVRVFPGGRRADGARNTQHDAKGGDE